MCCDYSVFALPFLFPLLRKSHAIARRRVISSLRGVNTSFAHEVSPPSCIIAPDSERTGTPRYPNI